MKGIMVGIVIVIDSDHYAEDIAVVVVVIVAVRRLRTAFVPAFAIQVGDGKLLATYSFWEENGLPLK